MISKDIIKECLEILEFNYDELDNGLLAVGFFDDEGAFDYQIVTFIEVDNERMVSFSSRAPGYHPDGDLLEMANRHNCRCHTPCCHIDSDGEIVMDRCFVIDSEVSPQYILENVVSPSIHIPIGAFMNFELSDSVLYRCMPRRPICKLVHH